MKDLFIKRVLFLISIFVIAIANFVGSYTKSTDFINLIPSIGPIIICVVATIIVLVENIKIKNNYENIKKEIAKEYDERDAIIDGKSSQVTLSLINILSIILMIFSQGKNMQMNLALFSILFVAQISHLLLKKYYDKIM